MTLYREILGDAFDGLADGLREFHDFDVYLKSYGFAQVERGRGLLSRCIGWMARLPPAAPRVPVRVDMYANKGREHWNRRFGDHAMDSMLSADRGILREQLGLATLLFRLRPGEDGGCIDWEIAGVQCLGVPLPAAMLRQVTARESLRGGIYHFEVRAALPLAGLIVRYEGDLRIESRE